jgi:hypothetical protein
MHRKNIPHKNLLHYYEMNRTFSYKEKISFHHRVEKKNRNKVHAYDNNRPKNMISIMD